MKQLKSSFIGFILFLSGFAMVWLTMNENAFDYNMDVEISPYGHSLSKTHLELGDDTTEGWIGMVINGKFTIYANWPPGPFILQSFWFKMLNRNDIYASRLLSALVYGLNSLLFFGLLMRLGKGTQVATFATLLFILLPLHLKYGSLIFADIWFVTFWLLAILSYNHNHLKHYWLFVLIILAGCCMFWFVIFLLPVPLIIYFIRRKHLGIKPILVSLGLFILILWMIQGLFVWQFPNSYALDSMRKHSFFGLFSNKKYYLFKLLERFATLAYELLTLLPLILFLKSWPQVRDVLMAKWRDDRLCQVLIALVLGYVLYVGTFSQWFAGHEQGVGMFSILIAGMAAVLLSELKLLLERNLFFWRAGLSIVLCLVLFVSLNLLLSNERTVEAQDKEIAAFINSTKQDVNAKVCLFFDVPRYVNRNLRIGRFAIREYTNGYTFNIDEMPKMNSIAETLEYGVYKLHENGINGFDDQSVFFISGMPHQLDGVEVTDSFSVNQLYVYQIDLE